jgi:hypothetical protein
MLVAAFSRRQEGMQTRSGGPHPTAPVAESEGQPAEGAPEHGRVLVEGVVLSTAVRWVGPESAHVIDSTEFDLRGEGDDWDEALASFWGRARDWFNYVAEIHGDGRLSVPEAETVLRLGPRIIEIVEQFAERVQSERSSIGSHLLAALNLRTREIVSRENTWDPDPEMPSSSTQLSRA